MQALALRVSMEEERARQTAATHASGDGDEGSADAVAVGGEPAGGELVDPACGWAVLLVGCSHLCLSQSGKFLHLLTCSLECLCAGSAAIPEPIDEDALLQEALALSMQMEQATPAAATIPATTPAAPAKTEEASDGDMLDDIDDPELALALQMSMAEAQPGDEGNKEEPHTE